MQLIIAVILISVFQLQVSSIKREDPVTCGSVIKLVHKETGNNLHSHAIAWGSGSGQQSVTSNSAKNEKSSLWLIKEPSQLQACEVGTPIKCGESIRLEHVDTKKNLHSHLFRAPLSGNQEVSAFGDGGQGDTGDNWEVVCEAKESFWMRYKPVAFKHVDTSKYLFTSVAATFNQQNCGGNCPIMSQTEISAAARKDSKTLWNTDQGVYFPPKGKQVEDEDEDL